ncbi:Serine/threonine-protein phosphatase 2A regulatory subunit B'' subunit alpha [Dermatophagoides pteronyssinus]|uniref:Serine/threonine-protein phosphatase 2A regulatory subunit B'' subunit alpha n=1 Tax=Dermatophagoides pteronyssinus TaxID=6956 RepID=A0ABQ8JR53_DERPT|nr:Serine/threonine-protein phosphatase 2A regulatory subunit B'' subunit alpha [Dermatophagoides pteronyssinus]
MSLRQQFFSSESPSSSSSSWSSSFASSTLPNRKNSTKSYSNDENRRRNSIESYDHHHQQQQLIKQPQSQQHRLVIYTNPQKYYSIRIDQPHRQAIHILPENYQFCSLGKKFRNTLNGPEIFGTCSAKVHFGKCTDFDVFVEQEQQQQKQQKIDDYDDTATLSDCKNFIYYKIKTPTKTATPIINIGSSGDGHHHRSITTTATNTTANDNVNIPKNVRSISSSSNDNHSSSSITSILSKIESYRDNLDAAIELLTNDELDNHNQRNELEHLIRNFVCEDRRQRQVDSNSNSVNHVKTESNIKNQQQQQQQKRRQQSSISTTSDTDELEKLALALVAESSHDDNNNKNVNPLSPTSSSSLSSSSAIDYPSSGRKILLKKSQADLLRQQQQNGNLNYEQQQQNRSSSPTPFLSTNRDGVVQSRLLRFSNNINQQHHQQQPSNSLSSSSSLSLIKSEESLQRKQCSSPTPTSSLIQQNGNENRNQIVFGISPKSSSLARYKNLIESRSETSSPIQLNFATGIDLYNLNLELENRPHDNDLTRNNNTSSNIKSNSLNYISSNRKQMFVNDTMANDKCSSLDSSHFIGNNHDICNSKSSSNNDGKINKKLSNNIHGYCSENDDIKNIGTDVIDTREKSPSSSSTSSRSSYLLSSNKTLGSLSTSNNGVNHGGGGGINGIDDSGISKFHHNKQQPSSPSVVVDSSKTSDPLLDFVARNQELNNHHRVSSSSSYHSSLNTINKDHYHNNNNNIISNDSSNKKINDNESSNNLNILTSNTIDTFIKENEKFFHSGGNRLSRSLGIIENENILPSTTLLDNYFDEMKYQQKQHSTMTSTSQQSTTTKSSLTDDEKALLHETLKVGQLYGASSSSSAGSGSDSSSDNEKSSQSSSSQQKRRIIFVSKPAPKPEPKPEPKYVNGKMVFGQVHVQQRHHHHGLQKGSVAERVMLFEKCPEKTSVTKHKLTELQRNRITNPNKIGSWMKFTETQAVLPQNDTTRNGGNLKIANLNNVVGEDSGNLQPVSSSTSTTTTTSVKSLTKNKIHKGDEPKSPPTITSIPTFRRLSRTNSGILPGQLPRFYYPLGRPYSSNEVENQIKRIISIFDRFPSRTVTVKELGGVLKLCGIPVYWKEPLFRSILADVKNSSMANGNCGGGGGVSIRRTNSIDHSSNSKNGFMANGTTTSNGNCSHIKDYITCDQFTNYWKKLISICYDDASRFIKIMTQGKRNYIIPEDFEPLIQDVIDTHPGLLFLKEAEEFHSRYVHTVIARIYYCVDKTWSGTITLPELKKSNLLRVIHLLEEEDDINQITEYFSYEHFYVIYCKFWELDQDHDLFISKYDLARHNDSAISSRMIDRIFSGAVTRTRASRSSHNNQMSYTEFVWFLLADEDKRHPRAIEYWFRCMDLDGDGCLSFYELEYFYNEQVKRMESAGIEALPFTDCLCQMIDLISPKDPSRITLSDLKKCRLTPIFFDTFFNLEKYLDHEQRDPFASQRDEDGVSMSDWDRYAAEEYELLVAEESAQNHNYHRTKALIHNNFNQHQIQQPIIDHINDDNDADDEQDHFSTTTSGDDDVDTIDDGRVYLVIESTIKNRSNSNQDDKFCDNGSDDKIEIDTNNNCKLNDDNSTVDKNDDDFVDNLDKEFYEYIQNEFETNRYSSRSIYDSRSINNHHNHNRPTMIVKPIKLVKLDPINGNDIVQRHSIHEQMKTAEICNINDDDDDDDFF